MYLAGLKELVKNYSLEDVVEFLRYFILSDSCGVWNMVVTIIAVFLG